MAGGHEKCFIAFLVVLIIVVLLGIYLWRRYKCACFGGKGKKSGFIGWMGRDPATEPCFLVNPDTGKILNRCNYT